MLTSKTRLAIFQENVEKRIFICSFITLEQSIFYFRVVVMNKASQKNIAINTF